MQWERIAVRVISFIISVMFAFDMLLIGFAPDKRLDVVQTSEEISYYVNGGSGGEELSFGVVGDGNLFAPGETVRAVFECHAAGLDGKRVKISVEGRQTGMQKREYVRLDSERPYNIFEFSSERNGIFTVSFELPDLTRYSFDIGILPRNERAGSEFYYGIQPYLTRNYLWGEGSRLPGCDAERSAELILNAADYLGVNLVREDGVGWGAMQSEAGGDVNFAAQDHIIGKITARGMKYNWLFGYNAGKWSAAEQYRENYDDAMGWTCPPDESLWAEYTRKVAEHYAADPNILWEIWNEPNWYFFAGSPEEYFSLLEKTASILKAENPAAYVYSGGLAMAHEKTNSVFYQKASELMGRGLLDNYGYHNHDGLESYYDNITATLELAHGAGAGGGFNSESGVSGANAATIACKALYTRSTGADGFVSFSFRKTVLPENDINDFSFFDEYLQPTEAVIAYATVIRFLGNADFVENVSNDKNLIIDRYTANGKITEVYYSLGEKTKISAPQGDFAAYDMYGNLLNVGRRLTVGEPVYIVYN